MHIQYIRQHIRLVFAIAVISVLFSGSGAYVLSTVLDNQIDANDAAQTARQRAYEAKRDAYTTAHLLRNAQVDACTRANRVRREVNKQVAVEQRQRDVFFNLLQFAARNASRFRAELAVFRDDVGKIRFRKLKLVECEAVVPPVKATPPVPPNGIVSEGVVVTDGIKLPAARTPTRATKIKRLLARHYGEICNTTVHRIPLVRVEGLRTPPQPNRPSRKVDGLAIMNRWPDPTRCIIYIERRRWATETLCILWAHELGHFEYGPGHNPRRDGRLMNPVLPETWGPCTRRFG